MKPEASIVIPSWNGARFVADTLARVAKLHGLEWECVVIDHGRLNRETENVLRRFSDPRIRYVGEDQQLGFAGAVNRGVREAKADLIAVLCNDVLVKPDWLAQLVAAHRRERAQGKSPVLFSLVRKSEIEEGREARMNLWFRVVKPVSPGGGFFHPDGNAFLFDRAVYGDPFDADYFLYQEDVYLGWRAWLMGQEVKRVDSSRADNFDGGTTRRTPYRTSFLTERNRWLNYFSFLSFGMLLRALPLLWLDALLKFVGGKNRLAKLHAWGWLLLHPGWILAKRKKVQAERKRSDREILRYLSVTYVDAPAGHPLNQLFWRFAKLLGVPLGN